MKRKEMHILAWLLALALFLGAAAGENADLLGRAKEYFEAGDTQRALACLDLAGRAFPKDPRTDLLACEICLFLQDGEGARKYADSALEKDPLSPNGWLLRVQIDILLEDLNALEKDLLYAEILGAGLSGKVKADVGLIYHKAQQNEKAAEWFAQAGTDALDEAHAAAYAQALNALGRREEADALGLNKATWRDYALAAAFDEDRLTAERASFDPSAFRIASADEIELPDYLYETGEADELDELLQDMDSKLKEGSIVPFSFSPSGDTAIVQLGDGVYAMHENVIRPIFPHMERGLGFDELKQPFLGMERLKKTISFADAAVWSHDGRYAVLTYYDLWAERGYSAELVLLDIWRGDEIFLESFARSAYKEDGGAVGNACFSQDDSELYYTVFARRPDSEKNIWLCRYDMETQQISRLQGSMYNEEMSDTYYPGLYMLSDGSFIALSQPADSSLPRGVVRIMSDGQRQMYLTPDEQLRFYSRLLLFSENSRNALSLINLPDGIGGKSSFTSGFAAFAVFQPETDAPEDGLALQMVHSRMENGKLKQYLSPMDINALREMTAVEIYKWSETAVRIVSMCLSPDGHYALAAANSRQIEQPLLEEGLLDSLSNSLRLLLIDLKTGDVRLVAEDPEQPLGLSFAGNSLVLEWNTDTVLLRYRNSVKAFRIR